MDYKPINVTYEEIGQGTPVILIHGFPLDHSTWKPVAELIKAEARVILPDLRGFGQSPVAADGSMRAMAEDIASLMDMLELKQAILVGHSMGGYVCLNFARAFPRRLRGLGLVTTQSAADPLEKRQARLVQAEEVKRKGVRILAGGMASRLTSRAELVEPIQRLILQTPAAGVVAALHGMAERLDATDWLAEVTVPTVVIAGSEDVIIPVERSRMMVQMLNHAWLVEVPGAGHLPMMEAPEVVAQALLQLIRLTRQKN